MNINPRVIKSKQEYNFALSVVDNYLNTKNLSNEDQLILETWSIIIEAYENEIFEAKYLHPNEFLMAHIENAGRTQQELADILGSASRASEVLAGKRELSKGMIKALVREWHIPAEYLLGLDMKKAA